MSPDRYLMACRLLRYLGEHEQAMAIVSDGLAAFPDDPRLLDQRGMLRLLGRDLPGAVADLEAALGRPLAPDTSDPYRDRLVADVLAVLLGGGAPASTDGSAASFGSSVRLHLGLARYLRGEFEAAAAMLRVAGDLAREPYQRLAARDYEYLSLCRSGSPEAARERIASVSLREMVDGTAQPSEALERCHAQRLHLYRGELPPEDLLRPTSDQGIDVATLGYGVGAWYLIGGYDAAAARTFERILAVGDPMSMGFLAAEVELARLEAPVTHASTMSAPASVGSLL